MPTINVSDELKVLHRMLNDGLTNLAAGKSATRPQIRAIIIPMAEILPDREDRLRALNGLMPPLLRGLITTNQLDLVTAGLLITWLYGLAPSDSLGPERQLAPYAVAVLESFDHAKHGYPGQTSFQEAVQQDGDLTPAQKDKWLKSL